VANYSGSSSTAYNTITISSSNPSTFSDPITSDTLCSISTISSVSTISATFLVLLPMIPQPPNYTQGAGSATVSLTLPSTGAVFGSPYSNTATFYFYNSGDIQSARYISLYTRCSRSLPILT